HRDDSNERDTGDPWNETTRAAQLRHAFDIHAAASPARGAGTRIDSHVRQLRGTPATPSVGAGAPRLLAAAPTLDAVAALGATKHMTAQEHIAPRPWQRRHVVTRKHRRRRISPLTGRRDRRCRPA